jgi:predicted enzyme related to lactoylglutathione lyase
MPEISEYQPGTPSWVDLGSPDLDRSIEFYGSLFGWEASRGGEEAGGYTMFVQDGKNICGLGPLFNEGQPPAWSTYVSVEDADKTAELVQAGGGTVLVPPMDVLDVGRMAVFLDSEGAAISVWQPRAHHGAGLVNEPVSLSWNELHTRDWDAAEQFYGPVFGWTFDRVSAEGPMRYAEIYLEGRMVGGVLPMGPEMPADVPAHWLAYFAVADVDATVAEAQDLGGGLLMPPMNIPQGRLAALTGPHGEAFAVSAMTETAR